MTAQGPGIKPMEYKVLVRPTEVEEKTKGGVFLPDTTKEKEKFGRMEGTLVAVSPMAFIFEGDWPEDAQKPQPGDKVVFAKYNAEPIKGKDGVEYWIMRDSSIIAVME